MKPILFNTEMGKGGAPVKAFRFPPQVADEMIRAILDGRKTVTRRVIKPQPYAVIQQENAQIWCGHFVSKDGKVLVDKPPYRPGDILYVRETWCKTDCFGLQNGYVYKANDNSILEQTGFVPKWHPSIHMPREAARIFLRVTDVRVERLQDISEAQARDEGVSPVMITADVDKPDDEKRWEEWIPALPVFTELWNGTIKLADLPIFGWGANPWVWVIEFERISKEEA